MIYKGDYVLRKDQGDNGYDLQASKDVTIKPMQTVVIPTSISIEFDQGIYADVRGRSGLSSKGIMCHLGLVDSSYRGEIKVSLTNLNCYPYEVEKGDRIAQLVFHLEDRVALRKSGSISKDTKRGEKGFGSSGR
ncbi:dUTP diphosphatase [Anaerococcus sp. AGMB09787]|uniref:dUTP diphosphatase n=1 Tax=Anaerococcus sp. AGMB09787 TaxID=2922869 RepID=UPI001FAEB215|nr:dUTP diphosphatase [Anaerococcus sp. AGMB09787]